MEEFNLKVTVRNNLVLTAITNSGYTNLAKFAKDNALSLGLLYDTINLKRPPMLQTGEFSPFAMELMEVLGACPTDLWTAEQLTMKLKKNVSYRELGKEELQRCLQSSARSLIGLDYPEQEAEENQATKIMVDAVDSLTPREAKVLKMHFGLDGEDQHTLEQIGEKMGVTRERIRGIEAKALSKMRHPSRTDIYKSLIED
jgi:RNA polymerase sigma factor (sigma-70 family)